MADYDLVKEFMEELDNAGSLADALLDGVKAPSLSGDGTVQGDVYRFVEAYRGVYADYDNLFEMYHEVMQQF